MSPPTRFIVPVALVDVMDALLPGFGGTAREVIEVTTMLNPEVPGRIAAGERWDIAMTNPWHVEAILRGGRARPDSHRVVGRSPLALGTRDDDACIVARSEPDIARLLCGAPSIAVTDTGTSGKTFRRLLRTLGLEEALAPALRFMAGGEPMAALLAGEVAVAALPLSNIAPVAGVRAAAICADALDVHIDLSLCTSRDASRHRSGAGRLAVRPGARCGARGAGRDAAGRADARLKRTVR